MSNELGKEIVDKAREQVGQLIGRKWTDIVFEGRNVTALLMPMGGL